MSFCLLGGLLVAKLDADIGIGLIVRILDIGRPREKLLVLLIDIHYIPYTPLFVQRIKFCLTQPITIIPRTTILLKSINM